jgi:hypothetical protein
MQLQRLVAVKVPHPDLIPRAVDFEVLLAEARTVSSLDHPNIVPVYGSARTSRNRNVGTFWST